MGFDLSKLVINALLTPTRVWNLNDRDWEDYEVKAFSNGLYIARIRISRAMNTAGRYNDIFFFDLESNPPIPKPFVYYQKTEEFARGQRISGRVIVLANEFYGRRLGTNLHSNIIFIGESKRVWEKLQEGGFAEYTPYKTEDGKMLDRWRVL